MRLVRKDRRLLRLQAKFSLSNVLDQARRGLCIEPLAHPPFLEVGPRGQLGTTQRSGTV